MARAVKEKADWLTKQEAAKLIGTSERSIERLVQAGHITQRYLRVTGRRPIAILDPGDVETIRQETLAKLPPPTVETSTALMTRPGRGMEAMPAFLAAMSAVQAQPKFFLTLKEASLASGLTVAYLRRLVDSGKLKHVRDRGIKVRRADLVKL
jgi:hypothetical protein